MFSFPQGGTTTLLGYIGKRNTGDDAFLAVSALALDQYLKPGEIYALAKEVPHSFGIPVEPVYIPFEFRGARLINDPLALRSIRKSSHILMAGGSIFHSAKSLNRVLSFLRQKRKGLAFAVGVSIGPFNDKEAPQSCASLLSGLDFIGVRDRISYERGKELCPQANIHYTFDLAPLLPGLTGFKPACRRNPLSLGVSLCNYERFRGGDLGKETERVERVARAIVLSAKKGSLQEVVLLDFNGHSFMGDHEIHSRLKGLIEPHVRVSHLGYSRNPLDFLERISSLAGMVSMRLHAGIFSFCVQTPSVMLAYHEKCHEWANTIGLPERALLDSQDIEPEVLSEAINSMLDQPESMTPSALSFEESVSRSLKNWTWIPEHIAIRGKD
jgi:polysaccharide pyruvyl transferase WcaK-like protein